ncbi:hypothetical protein [Nocardia sp. NPDC127526]|uniref:hypothetical protein n=1 Tax=Nocardia sp. NPDC127526 TaxID=3345393 RepID=UPI003634F45A
MRARTAFTRAALAAGDEVVAAARRPENMADIVAAHPDRVQVVQLDVRDAAAAVLAVVGQPNPPLRPDAVEAIRGKLAAVTADLDTTAHPGLTTAYDTPE